MPQTSIETMVLSDEYADLIVPVRTDPAVFIQQYQNLGAQVFGGRLGMIHIRRETQDFERNIAYSNIPKLYTLQDYESLTSSGILRVQTQSSLGFKGKDVILGFLDTGIDYTNPVFLDSFGNTRILGIWDQTVSSDSTPFDLGYGTAYTGEQINNALNSDDPFAIVPSEDRSGHGTFLAGVASGSPSPENQFLGAAPESDIAIVKLKEAKNYLKDYFFADSSYPVFQETDIMMGIRYLIILSVLYEKPLVICIGLGTNQGDHDGNSALDRLLTYYVDYQNCFCSCAAGNEAQMAHHFFSSDHNLTAAYAELVVPPDHPGFFMELWGTSPALFTLSVTSPLGETISEISTIQGQSVIYQFIAERTLLEIRYDIAEYHSGFQLIFIRLITPTEGVWTFRIRNRSQIQGDFHLWLPQKDLQSKDVFFLSPEPDTTITNPGNSESLITVGGYDSITGSIYPDSGRGYTLTGQIKPDLCAPAVDVYGPNYRTSDMPMLPSLTPFIRKNGTSASSAILAGSIALLINWNEQRSNPFLPDLTNRSVKNYLIRGARRKLSFSYPNQEWGYGELDLYGVFSSLLVT